METRLVFVPPDSVSLSEAVNRCPATMEALPVERVNAAAMETAI
jgi:hypothetical protein